MSVQLAARTRTRPHGAHDGLGPAAAWLAARWSAIIAALTLLSFAVAGWHPYAEDGGMYLTRVLLRLDPTLYPRCREFIVEPLRTSLFEPLVAALVKLHLPLPWAILALDLAALSLTLWAAVVLARRISTDERAQLWGVALLAACATVPVAGTSLLLFDPYLTARSLCAPFALFAAAWALDPWSLESAAHRRSAILCAGSLLLAFGFHPLMATYAAGLVIMLRLARARRAGVAMALAAAAALCAAVVMQMASGASTGAVRAADASRYYWFLSHWQWYELLGIAGPAALLALFAYRSPPGFRPEMRLLARATLGLVLCGVVVAVCCAQEHLASHLVARLQPLRVLWSAYAVLPLLLGALASQAAESRAERAPTKWQQRSWQAAPCAIVVAIAVICFAAQRAGFPSSPHIEIPGRANPNPWVQAFVWARDHTKPDALFALDARYVNRHGEDAQNFRAISLRSSLADFSKDGGEAAIRPSLAAAWLPAANAQRNLSEESHAERTAHLLPFAPDWLVLANTASTPGNCPYDNGVVKVCRFTP